MSTEENKALARRFIEAAWNAGHLAVVDAPLAPTFVNHSVPSGAAADSNQRQTGEGQRSPRARRWGVSRPPAAP